MSRSGRLATALASGAVNLIVVTLYSLLSLPLALSYLSVPEFGLWSLTIQVIGFLTLIDAGISGSISRQIVEFDARPVEQRRNLVRTVKLVTAAQGGIALVLGAGLAWFLPALLKIPSELQHTAMLLFLGQAAFFSMGLALKWTSHFLTASQRYDVINWNQTAGLLAQFFLLWLFFSCGFGVFALLGATGLVALAGNLHLCWAALRCRPEGEGRGGRFDWDIFQGLFRFGLNLFLQVLGWHLLSASQLIVISRSLGLEMAGIYTTCTRTFQLLQQFVYRIFDFAVPALAEMESKGETDRLRRRFLELAQLSGTLAACVGCVLAVTNAPFVRWWTKGAVGWDPLNDWLIAALLFAYTTNRVHGMIAWVTMDVRRTRLIYPIEGVFVVASSFFAASIWGVSGIIAVSVAGNFLFSGILGMRASRAGLGITVPKLVSAAWGQPLLAVIPLVPIAIGVQYGVRTLPSLAQMAILVSILVPLAVWRIWSTGLSIENRALVLAFLARWFPALRRRESAGG